MLIRKTYYILYLAHYLEFCRYFDTPGMKRSTAYCANFARLADHRAKYLMVRCKNLSIALLRRIVHWEIKYHKNKQWNRAAPDSHCCVLSGQCFYWQLVHLCKRISTMMQRLSPLLEDDEDCTSHSCQSRYPLRKVEGLLRKLDIQRHSKLKLPTVNNRLQLTSDVCSTKAAKAKGSAEQEARGCTESTALDVHLVRQRKVVSAVSTRKSSRIRQKIRRYSVPGDRFDAQRTERRVQMVAKPSWRVKLFNQRIVFLGASKLHRSKNLKNQRENLISDAENTTRWSLHDWTVRWKRR